MRRVPSTARTTIWLALILSSLVGQMPAADFDLDSAALQGTVVVGTDNADTMTMLGLGSSINAIQAKGAGDTITIAHGTVTGTATGILYSVDLGTGNDTFTVTGGEIGGALGTPGTTPDVLGGAGNDSFLISGGLIDGDLLGDLNDTSSSAASLAGNDSFQILGTAHVVGAINGEQGNDAIRVYKDLTGSGVVDGGINGDAGADTIEISDDAVIAGGVTGGDGNDTISAADNAVITGGINGDANDDRLNVEGNVQVTGTVAGGAGTDTINIFDNAIITGDVEGNSGNDTINVAGASAVSGNVDGGAGVNTIAISASATVGGDVLGGADSDTITLSTTGAVGGDIVGGGGLDTLVLQAAAAQSLSFANQIQDVDNLKKTGAGQWTLSDVNIGTVGNLTVESSGGALVLGGALAVTDLVQVRSGGTLTANGTLAAGDISLAGGALNAAAAVTVDDTVTIQTGTFTAGSTLATGDLIVRGGALTTTGLLTAVETVGPPAHGGNVRVSGGTLTATGGFLADKDVTITGGVFNVGNTSTIVGSTAVSNGAFNLNANLTAAGPITVSGGTLAVGPGATLTAADAVTVAGGALTLDAGATLAATDATVLAAGAISGAGMIDGGVGGGALVVGNGGTLSGITLNRLDVTLEDGAITDAVTLLSANSLTATGGQTVTNTNITATITGELTVKHATTMTGSGTYVVGTNMTIEEGSTVSGDNAFQVVNNLTVQGEGSTLNVINNEVVQVVAGTFTLADGASTEGDFQLQLGANGMIQDGATLGGNLATTTLGTLTVQEGATLAAGNSIGRQNFAGTTTWNRPYIQVEFGNAANDVYAATGGALTLNGGLVQPAVVPNYLLPSVQNYDFLIKDGGAIVLNSALAVDPVVQANSPIFVYSLSYTGAPGDVTAYTLTVNRNLYEDVATTSNQEEIGALFDSAVPTASGDFAIVLSNIDRLTSDAAVGAALDAVSPEPYADLGGINIVATDAFLDRTIDRLVHLADPLDSSCADPCNSVRLGGCNFWTHNLGSWENQDSVDTRFGYSSDLYGVVLGLDERADNFTFGISSGYASQQVRFDSLDTRDDATYFNLLVYGSLKDCGRFINLGGGYTRAWNNMHRRLVFTDIDRQALSDADTHLGSAFLQGGWAFWAGGPWALTPMATVRYTCARTDDLTEHGADSLDLSIDSLHRDSCAGELGGKLSFAVRPRLRAEAYAAYVHEFSDVVDSVDATFAGDPTPFSISGVPFGRDSARVSVLLVGDLSPRVAIYGTYDGRFRASYSNNAATLGLSVRY